MSWAIVVAAWAPVRAEPSHRAEMTSQWLCGETLRVAQRSGDWLKCEGPDGYQGWSPAGSLLEVSGADAESWRLGADGWSLGAALAPADPGLAEAQPNHLPWGSRVRILGDGQVGLPGDGLARVVLPGNILRHQRLDDSFSPEGSSIVRTAEMWLGAPYAWGGRTQMGVDCSGLVQAVYAVHRIRLPRDSADQAHVHAGLRLKDGHPGDPKPGDLLFFAPEEKGVTHVAIVVDAHRIVHAAASRGCVKIDNLLEADPLAERLRNSIVGWTRPLATS